jgi:hypothetical protein
MPQEQLNYSEDVNGLKEALLKDQKLDIAEDTARELSYHLIDNLAPDRTGLDVSEYVSHFEEAAKYEGLSEDEEELYQKLRNVEGRAESKRWAEVDRNTLLERGASHFLSGP